jgi:hypothetical protein
VNLLSLFGERSLTVAAAAVDDRRQAESATDNLCRQIDKIATVAVVSPGDTEVARKMEPEQRGIWRTLVRSHLILGAGGIQAFFVLFAATCTGTIAASYMRWVTPALPAS